MMDEITRLPLDVCPGCGHELDAVGASQGEPVRPEPGDVSVCLVCGHPMVFTDTMRLRSMTTDEWKALSEGQRQEFLRVRWFAEYLARVKQSRWN